MWVMLVYDGYHFLRAYAHILSCGKTKLGRINLISFIDKDQAERSNAYVHYTRQKNQDRQNDPGKYPGILQK